MAVGLALLSGCGGDDPIASLPIADAGFDRVVAVAAEVRLDGRASTDPDGRSLTHLWQLDVRPEGSATALIAADTAEPRLTPDVAGAYLATLVVDNGRRESLPDRVAVLARGISANQAPVADAACQAGNCNVAHGEGQLVLNGNQSFDPDGDSLTFVWTQVTGNCAAECPALLGCTPLADAVTWVGATTVASPRFTAPYAVGTLVLKLTVSDPEAASDSACVAVQSTNNPPIVASISAPAVIVEGEPLILAGTCGDNDVLDRPHLTYAWSPAPSAELFYDPPSADTSTVTARVSSLAGTTVTFTLTVFDGFDTGSRQVEVAITGVDRLTGAGCYFDSECTLPDTCNSILPAAGTCQP